MLDLPSDIVIYIVGEWLDFISFGKLDIAVGNHVERKIFLKILQSDAFVFFGSVLEINNSSTSSDIIEWILRRKIKIGKLYHVVGEASNVKEVIKFLKPLYNCLQHFEWNTEDDNSDFNVFKILNNFKSITYLDIDQWDSKYFIKWSFVARLLDLTLTTVTLKSTDLVTIGTHCSIIRMLDVSLSDYEEGVPFPTKKIGFQSLQSLNCMYFPFEAVEYIIHNATGLKTIKSVTCITSLLLKCKNLTDVEIGWEGEDTNNDLTKFFAQSPQLNGLFLQSKTFKVSDNCIKTLGITCVNIIDLILMCRDEQVEVCAIAVSQMKLLRKATISHNALLEALMDNCCLLEDLSATSIEFINNDILTRLPRAFPKLERLSINYGDATNEMLFELAKHCPLLSDASYSKASELTDESITTLLQGCPDIAYLFISSANLVTDRIADTIVTYGKNLTDIQLCGDNLTANAFTTLQNCSNCVCSISFAASTTIQYSDELSLAILELMKVKSVVLGVGYEEFEIECDDDSDVEGEGESDDVEVEEFNEFEELEDGEDDSEED